MKHTVHVFPLYVYIYCFYRETDNMFVFVSVPHSNHMTFCKQVNTYICHITMCRNSIHFLYNSDDVTL